VHYGEGLFIGYRYYDTRPARAVSVWVRFKLYDFRDHNSRVSATTFNDVDGVTASVDVTNTGKMAGKEVVQVYVHDQQSSLVRPTKELKGFAKVSLEPGETKTVSVHLDSRAFAFYHPGHQQWITESGDSIFCLGHRLLNSCATNVIFNPRLTYPACSRPSPLSAHGSTTRVATRYLRQTFKDSMKQLKMDPNAYARTGEARGSYPMDGIMDMPIRSVIHFREKDLPMPADA